MSTPNQIQIDKWRQYLTLLRADAAAWGKYGQVNERRTVVRNEVVSFLKQYLTGGCDTENLRETFQRKTTKEWLGFGFKGFAGAMFLNMLVRNIADAESLSAQLRMVLPVPTDSHEGRNRLQSFVDYLTVLIESGKVKRAQVRPASAPFFVSGWWNLQDAEQWPIFYISGRRALGREALYSPAGDPVEDYFAFRECFLSLAAALELSCWDCEHLLHWCDKHPPGLVRGNGLFGNGGSTRGGTEETGDEKADPSPHVHMQWLLAKIGQKVDCKVWIAANDHNKEWKGERLRDLSISELPALGLDPESQKVIRMIDVVWLKGAHQVAAAFEIELTTSIYSGLLRMSDLVSLSPNLNFPLYLIAPEDRLNQVKTQLSRATFQRLRLHKRCGYLSCESLLQHSDGILRWANSPSVIEELAAKVEDTQV